MEALVAAAIIASVILGRPVYSIAHDCRKFPLIYRPSQLLSGKIKMACLTHVCSHGHTWLADQVPLELILVQRKRSTPLQFSKVRCSPRSKGSPICIR